MINTVGDMPCYRCVKEVRALKISDVLPVVSTCETYQLHFEDKRFAPRLISGMTVYRILRGADYRMMIGGYLVVDFLDVPTWWPAAAFENDFELIEDAPKDKGD